MSRGRCSVKALDLCIGETPVAQDQLGLFLVPSHPWNNFYGLVVGRHHSAELLLPAKGWTSYSVNTMYGLDGLIMQTYDGVLHHQTVPAVFTWPWYVVIRTQEDTFMLGNLPGRVLVERLHQAFDPICLQADALHIMAYLVLKLVALGCSGLEMPECCNHCYYLGWKAYLESLQ